jgi:hypothetical protein
MVRPKQQTDGVLERFVAGEPAGIRMAVRAYDGQRFDRPEQTRGDRAELRIRRKESVRIQMK